MGVVLFQMGRASFLCWEGRGGAPWGASVLVGGFKKYCRMEGVPIPMPPTTMGNPWWCSETLFKTLVWRVQPENSSHEPHLDDKNKSEPHRSGAKSESQMTTLYSFWNNLSFTLRLGTSNKFQWVLSGEVSNLWHKPLILVFKKNFIVISYYIL